jgi:hypothetical protein
MVAAAVMEATVLMAATRLQVLLQAEVATSWFLLETQNC